MRQARGGLESALARRRWSGAFGGQTMMKWWKRNRQADEEKQGPVIRCSFCNKSLRVLAKIIAGPRVYICSECVEICNSILADELAEGPTPEPSNVGKAAVDSSPPIWCALCDTSVPVDHALAVRDRGWVCRRCAGAVNEALSDTTRKH